MRRIALLAITAGSVVPLMASAPAHAQSRTWVSGVGDDTNPCSRTAPCKTFAGAISKTASGGIINCMDPGGFGPLTITKSLIVDCRPFLGAMLASGGINAVNVAAGVNDIVTLMGLDIEGEGTTLGLNGIRITQAKTVHILDTQIHRFSRSGVTLEPNAGVTTTLTLDRVDIHDNNGNGI